MRKHAIATDDAGPPAGPYSQGVRAGPFVFLAGQIPAGPDGKLIGGDFETQARQVLTNLAAIAAAAGSSLADAVQVGVYLNSRDDFAAMNDLFAEHFPPPRPARTTIQTQLPGFAIEIDAVLLAPSS